MARRHYTDGFRGFTRTNLYVYSQQFDQWPTTGFSANWALHGPPVTFTPNAGIAPDGTKTAGLVVDLSCSFNYCSQDIVAVGGQRYHWSCYIESGGTGSTTFEYKIWDWNTSTVLSTEVQALTALSGTWTRFTASTGPVPAGHHISGLIYPGRAGTGVTSSLFVWGADFEIGPGGDYIPTTSVMASLKDIYTSGTSVAVWRLDESDLTGQVIDEVGRYPLTASNSAYTSLTGALVPDGGRARYWIGGAGQLSASGDVMFDAAITGSWTIGAWIRLDKAMNNQGRVVSYGNGGGKERANLYVTNLRKISSTWNLPDASYIPGPTSPNGLPTGSCHVAARKSVTGPVSATLDLFVNGVNVASTSNLNSNLITNSQNFLHVGSILGSEQFSGTIDDVAVYARALADVEILDIYNYGLTGHLMDSGTVALWRFDETGASDALLDETGRYNANADGTASISVPGQVGGARQVYTNVSFTTSNFRNTDGGVALNTIYTGSWTWENWYWIDPSVTGSDFKSRNGTFACVTDANSIFIVGLAVGGQFRYASGGGGPTVLAGNWSNLSRGTWHHLAIRSAPVNATLASISFFSDGILAATVANQPIATASCPSPRWIIGQENLEYFIGRLDDMRFSNVVRTDAEIFDSWNRGWNGLGGSPAPYLLSKDPTRRNTVRALRFANVPSSHPELAATAQEKTGIRRFNRVHNVTFAPSDNSSLSGVVTFRSRKRPRLPTVVTLPEGRNTDQFGNPKLPGTGG